MNVVKDVDLEAMPTSIFLNDDDDDDELGLELGKIGIVRLSSGSGLGSVLVSVLWLVVELRVGEGARIAF